MTMMAMETGDPVIANMTARARNFLLRFALPDGGTLGCFDGRTPHLIGQCDVGFATSPFGRRLNRQSIKTRLRRGIFSIRESTSDLRQAHGAAAAMADSLGYWRDRGVRSLPQEQDGYADRFNFGLLSGSLTRELGWLVGLNAMIGELPLLISNAYITERQNRIDIWHQRSGMIIGGGSTPMLLMPPGQVKAGEWLPITNVLIVTGFGNELQSSCEFGLIRATDKRWAQGIYFPLAVRILETGRCNALRLDYTHAVVIVTVRPQSVSRLSFKFCVEHKNVPRIILQLPLVVYQEAKLLIDGKLFKETDNISNPVQNEVEICGSASEPAISIRIAVKWPTRVRHTPGGGIGFRQDILSVQVDTPPERFEVEFNIKVAN